jgi:hypothetical protein
MQPLLERVRGDQGHKLFIDECVFIDSITNGMAGGAEGVAVRGWGIRASMILRWTVVGE